MTPEQVAEIRMLLENKRNILVTEARERLDGLRQFPVECETYELGERTVLVPRAESLVAAELFVSAGEKLTAVKEALERLDDGSYGTCEDCDSEIPFSRLKAVLGTRRCCKCQGELEKSSRSRSLSEVRSGRDFSDDPEED